MPAKNDITNSPILTSAYSEQGRSNHDRIFARKTAHEWAALDGITILDPDGYRWNDGVTMDTLTSYNEYLKRIIHCTIFLLDQKSIQKAAIID